MPARDTFLPPCPSFGRVVEIGMNRGLGRVFHTENIDGKRDLRGFSSLLKNCAAQFQEHPPVDELHFTENTADTFHRF